MTAASAGVKDVPTGDALRPLPKEQEGRREIVWLLACSALLFLFARSIVWGKQVSLIDAATVALGMSPVVLAVICRLVSQSRSGATNVVRVVGWGWALSLFTFVVLHALRLFEAFEQPIRATLGPGLLRYVCYGLIYSMIAYLTLVIVAALFGSRSFAESRPAVFIGGLLFNSFYFGVALFLVRF